MKRLLFGFLTILTTAAFMQSCSDDDAPSLQVYQNIVTYIGNGDNYCQFSYQAIDDSPLIILTSQGNTVKENPDEGEVPGSRMFLTYSLTGATQPNSSGTIQVIGISKVYQCAVESQTLIPENFTEPYSVISLTRSGNYLNLFAVAGEVGFKNREFTVIADESTLDDEYPQIYICTNVKNGVVASLDTRVIGSFDISSVWNLPTAKGVEVHVAKDADPTAKVFKFEK